MQRTAIPRAPPTTLFLPLFRILAGTIRTRAPLSDVSWYLPPSLLLVRLAETASRINQELLNHHTINIPSPNIGGAIDREQKRA